MNRKIVLLNVLLLVLLVWLGTQLRAKWQESKAREAAALARDAKPGQVVPPPGVPSVDPASPADYLDVAQRMLFSKDRDPNVIIDVTPPPPPPPEKPVPALPKYYGQMSLGEPVILLSTEKTPQKSYQIGDKVGEFKLTDFDADTVTLEWDEKVLKNNVKDLIPKEPERPVQAAAATPAAPAPNRSVAKMGETASTTDPVLGPPNGMYRGCVAGDNSPSGTILNGYRKVVVPGLMGTTCHWEPIR